MIGEQWKGITSESIARGGCRRQLDLDRVICICRRMMIEKIVSHVADFSPRLQSNTRALYQYCPIPIIVYPPLEYELFCNIYYLRHLCDTTKFPDWPIKDPVSGVVCF